MLENDRHINVITSESHADDLDQINMYFSHTDDVKIQNNIKPVQYHHQQAMNEWTHRKKKITTISERYKNAPN